MPDRPGSVAPRDRESAFDFVARQADAHHLVWVVAPETDGLLAQFQRRVDPARWLGCDGLGDRACLGQARTRCWRWPGSASRRRWTSNTRRKSHAGWSSRTTAPAPLSTRLHTSLEAALEDWSQHSRTGPMAIEPWVEGRPAQPVAVVRRGTYRVAERQPPAAGDRRRRACCRFTASRSTRSATHDLTASRWPRWHRVWANGIPGLRGFVGIDLVWHAQRGPVVIEINPRVTMRLRRPVAGAGAQPGKRGHRGS